MSGGGGSEDCSAPFSYCGAGKVCNQAGHCVPKLCEPLPANVPNCVKDFPCHIGHCPFADQPCIDLSSFFGFASDGTACGSTPGATCHNGNCLTAQCGPGLYCDPSCTDSGGAQLPNGTVCKAGFVCLNGLCKNQLYAQATPFVLATNLSISTTLAIFTDSLTTETSAAFTATIDWGDGSTTAGVVSDGADYFSVSGSHTYSSHAPVSVLVTITDVVTTNVAGVTFSAGYVLNEWPVQSPVGITIDALNALWVTQQSAQIAQLSYQGVPTEFAAPPGAAITHTSNIGLWYIEPTKIALVTSDEDLYGGPSALVIKEFPLLGPGRTPMGITLDPEGLDAWFTETGRIGRITQAGTITEYPIPTPNSDPRGITRGGDGNIWFTEYAASKIGMITPNGVITEFPTLTPLSYPDGITFGPDGSLWFTEAGKNAIARIDTSGDITEYPIPTAAAFPHAIMPGLLGKLWFTEPGANKIGVITQQGQITEYPLPTPNSMPWDLATTDGVWFTERSANQVGHLQAAE
jgi:streptogramin lyase